MLPLHTPSMIFLLKFYTFHLISKRKRMTRTQLWMLLKLLRIFSWVKIASVCKFGPKILSCKLFWQNICLFTYVLCVPHLGRLPWKAYTSIFWKINLSLLFRRKEGAQLGNAYNFQGHNFLVFQWTFTTESSLMFCNGTY